MYRKTRNNAEININICRLRYNWYLLLFILTITIRNQQASAAIGTQNGYLVGNRFGYRDWQPSSVSISLTLSLTLLFTLSIALFLSLTLPLALSLTHSVSHSVFHSVCRSFSLSYSPSRSVSHTLCHSIFQLHIYYQIGLRKRQQQLCLAKRNMTHF